MTIWYLLMVEEDMINYNTGCLQLQTHPAATTSRNVLIDIGCHLSVCVCMMIYSRATVEVGYVLSSRIVNVYI